MAMSSLFPTFQSQVGFLCELGEQSSGRPLRFAGQGMMTGTNSKGFFSCVVCHELGFAGGERGGLGFPVCAVSSELPNNFARLFRRGL